MKSVRMLKKKVKTRAKRVDRHLDKKPVKTCKLIVTVDERRCPLLTAFAAMPDEAFGYLLRAPLIDFFDLAKNGGFRPDSRKSFKEVATAAETYVKGWIK